MSRTLSYLWCVVFVVCSGYTHIGYDPSNETSVENRFSKPAGGKRDDSIVDGVYRRTNKQDYGQAICRKKSKGGVRWGCKTIASCTFGQKLLSANQQTVCGKEGLSQKICCPYLIDPVKVAQEKCVEYHSSRSRRDLDGYHGPSISPGNPDEVRIEDGEDLSTNSDVEWPCSATLISPQYLLTAAHCSISTIKLDFGVLGNTAKSYRIVEHINHPDYKKEKYDNDIALLKLDRTVKFSWDIRPVCLALPPKAKYNASQAIVTGWGEVGANGITSKKLLWTSISPLDNNKCVKAFENETRLSKGFDAKSMICAGHVAPSDGATCQGDSGGPLLFRVDSPEYRGMWLQAGITSLGASNCEDEEPEIYTRVSNFLPWIQSKVWPVEDLIGLTRLYAETNWS